MRSTVFRTFNTAGAPYNVGRLHSIHVSFANLVHISTCSLRGQGYKRIGHSLRCCVESVFSTSLQFSPTLTDLKEPALPGFCIHWTSDFIRPPTVGVLPIFRTIPPADRSRCDRHLRGDQSDHHHPHPIATSSLDAEPAPPPASTVQGENVQTRKPMSKRFGGYILKPIWDHFGLWNSGSSRSPRFSKREPIRECPFSMKSRRLEPRLPCPDRGGGGCLQWSRRPKSPVVPVVSVIKRSWPKSYTSPLS